MLSLRGILQIIPESIHHPNDRAVQFQVVSASVLHLEVYRGQFTLPPGQIAVQTVGQFLLGTDRHFARRLRA